MKFEKLSKVLNNDIALRLQAQGNFIVHINFCLTSSSVLPKDWVKLLPELRVFLGINRNPS